MILRDYHVHTCFCDGISTPEEVVESALRKGLLTLGFSGHGYTPVDGSYCMSPEKTAAYLRCIGELKERYRDRITILCGVEQDYCAGKPIASFDYVIGSAHYLQKDGCILPVDLSRACIEEAVRDHFSGDIYAYCEAYYEAVSQVVEATGADLIGHFDLIAKFNEDNGLFDRHHPRYVAAWQRAADQLLATSKPFEINTGAISRGYRVTPYPDAEILTYLSARGACFLLCSDSHSADTVGYDFPAWEAWARDLGVKLLPELP